MDSSPSLRFKDTNNKWKISNSNNPQPNNKKIEFKIIELKNIQILNQTQFEFSNLNKLLL
jgi:hypothetical protein